MDPITSIKNILSENIRTNTDLSVKAPLINEIASAVISSLKNGGKVIAFGNGGSASDSQHLVAEFVGRFNKEKKPLAAISLTVNTSIITAISNDYGYDYSFSKQVEANGKKGDVAFAISTSGNAKNVVEAVMAANKIGIKTIALSGKDGGQLSKISNLSLIVPSNNTARIQEAHILAIHIICELVEEAFT